MNTTLYSNSPAISDIKTVTVMRRKDGMSHEEFVDEWLGEHARLAKRCPGLLRYSQTVINSASARPGMPSFDMEADGIGQLYFSNQNELDRFNGSPEATDLRAHGLTIIGRQINFTTTEHVPIPLKAPETGKGPAKPELKFLALLARKPGMDREDFLSAWLDDHAGLAHTCPEIMQFVLTRIDASGARPGMPSWDVAIDGMAELYFSDAETLKTFNAAPTTIAFRGHGETFIGRQINFVTSETIVIPDGAPTPVV